MREIELGDPSHSEGLTEAQEELAQDLFEIGAIKFGEFTLKVHQSHPEAPLSPIYIDLRMLRRFPDAKSKAVDVYQELLKPLPFELIADIPTAATPIVSSLSDRLGVGMITPRMGSKGYGVDAKIDGFVDGQDEIRALREGADDFMSKEVEFGLLEARIEALLRRLSRLR